MIKAEELRIGNWIKEEGYISCAENLKVDLDLMQDIIENSQREFQGEDDELYYPIPFTEEILLKCGFEILGLSDRNNYSVIKNTEGYFFIDCMEDITIGKELKSVHQLQNLYYAITGEDLTINL